MTSKGSDVHMNDDPADTVLQRKAQAQRRALGVGAVSLPRALGRALSIAADALWGVGLAASQSKDETLSADRAVRRIGDDDLLIILENDSGPCGLAAFGRDVVTGLIEVQTLGKVTRFPTDDRPYTPTDAAMMAPLLDAGLPRFASMLAGQPEMAHLNGYRFGAMVEDAQTAGLALDAEQYHATRFDVSLAQDTRSGQVLFLFPEPPKPDDTGKLQNTGKHEGVLKLVPARMQLVLTRIHIPLDKVQALRPGDVLPISAQAMSSACLVGAGGHVVARGKLGQMNGMRAVRIGGTDKSVHKPDAADQAEAVVKMPDQPASGTALAPSATSFAFDGGFDMALDEIAADLPVIQPADGS